MVKYLTTNVFLFLKVEYVATFLLEYIHLVQVLSC